MFEPTNELRFAEKEDRYGNPFFVLQQKFQNKKTNRNQWRNVKIASKTYGHLTPIIQSWINLEKEK